MNIPIELEGILESTPDTLSGAVRFVGTRVPVEALLDELLCGCSVEAFLEGYPGVKREQVEAVLRWEQNSVREIFGLKKVS